VEELRATLNPVRLLQEIRAAQHQLVEIADRPALGDAARPTAPAGAVPLLAAVRRPDRAPRLCHRLISHSPDSRAAGRDFVSVPTVW